jgi:hypothetical protein
MYARAKPLQLFVFECLLQVGFRVCLVSVNFYRTSNEHVHEFSKLFSTAVIRVSLRLYLNFNLRPICFFLRDVFYM